MQHAPDPLRREAAEKRFVAFFRELSRVFVEREDVLMQIALALLGREHVLLTGPPGTAKSLLASSIFGRLLDEATGSPSLYARQFTESTVQTDLIGPINFKTLTETGRTEHFTDEGMLGAVHAFLDEVFDGRDMLLRSALNVLHERELKQGTRITRGRFECALMASNRYLVEVLESSRETLLAFVDRIAFVGFVPRSFADPQNLSAVLRAQVGGTGAGALEAQLSIQDVDALQREVDSVYIADPICDGLAAMLDVLDGELNAAVRADPTFLPTRYLSTRTAVRCGRILRAICVYDKLFHRPSRPLEVTHDDLASLRLHLLLSGPPPDAIAKLLEREADPRERRQLGILRTEREIFERCFAKLPRITAPPRPAPAIRVEQDEKGRAGQEALGAGAPAAAAQAAQKPSERAPSPVEAGALAALKSGDIRRIAEAMRALVPASHGAGPAAERAAEILRDCVMALNAQAIHAGLASSGEERALLADAATELGSIASTLEQATPKARALARWLRGRALVLLGDIAGYSLAIPALLLDEATSGRPAPRSPMEHAAARVEALEALSVTRKRLFAEGADPKEASEAAWARGLERAEDDLVLLCDAAVHEAATRRLSDMQGQELGAVLERLAPEFDRVGALERRLAALREGRSSLRERALGPRIGLLIAAAFARIDAGSRSALSGEIEATLAVLQRAGLSGVIAPRAWITWTAEALLRSEARAAAEAPPEGEGEELGYEGYRSLRGAAPRVLSAFVLAEVALRVSPELASSGATSAPGGAAQGQPASPPATLEGDGGALGAATSEGLAGLVSLLAELPKDARASVVRHDFDRLERAATYLERWWQRLDGGAPDAAAPGDAGATPDERVLKAIVRSKFFAVLLDEAAIVRFMLEAKLLAELFPDQAGRAEALRARLHDLQERARRRTFQLFKRRADAAWSSTLRAPAEVGRAP